MRNTTVLVVEDDARVAAVIADQLREEQYEVLTARTAKEAQASIRARPPDVVVLDVMLPDGSGFELCRTIRRGGLEWDPATGILLLTARVEEADVLRGFERGADDYLRKPFSLPELVARVRAVAERRRRTSSEVLQIGPLRVDLGGRLVSYAGTRIELSAKEFALLAELAA